VRDPGQRLKTRGRYQGVWLQQATGFVDCGLSELSVAAVSHNVLNERLTLEVAESMERG